MSPPTAAPAAAPARAVCPGVSQPEKASGITMLSAIDGISFLKEGPIPANRHRCGQRMQAPARAQTMASPKTAEDRASDEYQLHRLADPVPAIKHAELIRFHLPQDASVDR